ncbi:hypothetical protein SODG_002501 [Sodalis praecaptivus]
MARGAENTLALLLVTKMFLGDRWEYLFRTAGEQFVVRAYGEDSQLDGVCSLTLPADKVWIFPASTHAAP